MIVRRLPKEGSADTLYKRLKEYIIPVDLDWERKLKPAKQEDINQVYELSRIQETGYQLPISYLEYLKYMGEDDGKLLVSALHLSETNLTTILKNYEEMELFQDPDDMINPYEFIFAYNEECSSGYCITTVKEGKQYITSGEEERDRKKYFSENFEKLLFQTAYKKYEKEYFKHNFSFQTNEISVQEKYDNLQIDGIIPLVAQKMSKYGFERVWFSDAYNLIMENENISIGIWMDFAIYVYVLGDDKEQVKQYGNILNKILGAYKE